MYSTKTLLFLGKKGFSGELIHGELSDRSSVLAPEVSRDRPLAEQLIANSSALKPGDLVFNALGPFIDSYLPVLEFCLARGLHYFDICGEWQVFEAMQQWDYRAVEAGCMILPGIGFDVVASDCLVGHVHRRLPDVSRLQIGISGLGLISRGSARTLRSLMGEPLRQRRRGRLVSEARIREERFDFGQGECRALGVSWGDISTAWHSTRVPDIEVFFQATPALSAAVFANRTFGWLAAGNGGGVLSDAILNSLPKGPTDTSRADKKSVVIVRASNSDGVTVASRLQTPEAYTFTAHAAAATLEHFLRNGVQPGFQTPSTALGPDFPLALPDCERQDVL